MFTINRLRVNADKFYDYLDNRMIEIEAQFKEDQNYEFSNLSLDRDGSKILMTVTQSSKSGRGRSNQTVEVLEVDCDKFDLSSSLFNTKDVEFCSHKIFDLKDLFKLDMIKDKNVVFVVLGDVSEEMYSVDYYVKGIFTDIDRAFRYVNDAFNSIVATKLDEANDFYVGGYME